MSGVLRKCVIFQNDDALEEIREGKSRSQSRHPGSDNDGLFSDPRGHSNLFQIFLGRAMQFENATDDTPGKQAAYTAGDSGAVVGNLDNESRVRLVAVSTSCLRVNPGATCGAAKTCEELVDRPEAPHSCRKATKGSMAVARRAGK